MSFKTSRLNVRQPQVGAPVHPASKVFQFQKNFTEAKLTAERLDQRVNALMSLNSMRWWQRWNQSIDITQLEYSYKTDVIRHLAAMAEIMKMRRESGGKLKALYEFEFQTLLRKSDYVLALNITSPFVKKVPSNILSFYRLERKVTSLKPLVASN